jgi:CheY-like chemotaxis protein
MVDVPRVLIVDDESIVRMCCERSLLETDYDTTCVSNAFEALERLKNESFDVIVTDLKMPDMDGLEFIHVLKRTWGDVKVILTTGYATDEARQQTRELNVGYLPKPFNPDELKQAISNILKG